MSLTLPHDLPTVDEAAASEAALTRFLLGLPAVDATGLAPVDLVIVLVKSFHTRDAMAGATSLVGPDTMVLSLQNGLGHEDILAEVVGREHVLAGLRNESRQGAGKQDFHMQKK